MPSHANNGLYFDKVLSSIGASIMYSKFSCWANLVQPNSTWNICLHIIYHNDLYHLSQWHWTFSSPVRASCIWMISTPNTLQWQSKSLIYYFVMLNLFPLLIPRHSFSIPLHHSLRTFSVSVPKFTRTNNIEELYFLKPQEFYHGHHNCYCKTCPI